MLMQEFATLGLSKTGAKRLQRSGSFRQEMLVHDGLSRAVVSALRPCFHCLASLIGSATPPRGELVTAAAVSNAAVSAELAWVPSGSWLSRAATSAPDLYVFNYHERTTHTTRRLRRPDTRHPTETDAELT